MADQNRRVRPIVWAREEDLQELSVHLAATEAAVEDVMQRIAILATGMVDLMSQVYEIQTSLYGEEPDEDEREPEERREAIERTSGALTGAYEEAEDADDAEIARWAEEEAARLRAEADNEATPEEIAALDGDPNSITDVPEEGVVVDPGRPIGALHAEWERERDE